METSALEFRAKWYVVERALMDAASLSFFHDYALALANSSTIALGDGSDRRRSGRIRRPASGHASGKTPRQSGTRYRIRALPTYSYLRVYKRGNLLKAHRDRPACEISMTVNLGMSAEEPWPIWIAGPRGHRLRVAEPRRRTDLPRVRLLSLARTFCRQSSGASLSALCRSERT